MATRASLNHRHYLHNQQRERNQEDRETEEQSYQEELTSSDSSDSSLLISFSNSTDLSESSSSLSLAEYLSVDNDDYDGICEEEERFYDYYNGSQDEVVLEPVERSRIGVLPIIYSTYKTIMNAAVTIFGVGVGVGLIMGDSFRGRNSNIASTHESSTASNDDRNEHGDDGQDNIPNSHGYAGRANNGSSTIDMLPPQ